jgi:hypothetical protein
MRVEYFFSRSYFLDCPRLMVKKFVALYLITEVYFALIIRYTFWFCSLVIEGSALKLPQTFREKFEQKLSSLAFYPTKASNKVLTFSGA